VRSTEEDILELVDSFFDAKVGHKVERELLKDCKTALNAQSTAFF